MAAGRDEIPIQLFKNLGPKSKPLMTNAIGQVFKPRQFWLDDVKARLTSSTKTKLIWIKYGYGYGRAPTGQLQ